MSLAITAGMRRQAAVREDNREDAEIVATVEPVLNELFLENKGVLSRALKKTGHDMTFIKLWLFPLRLFFQ